MSSIPPHPSHDNALHIRLYSLSFINEFPRLLHPPSSVSHVILELPSLGIVATSPHTHSRFFFCLHGHYFSVRGGSPCSRGEQGRRAPSALSRAPSHEKKCTSAPAVGAPGCTNVVCTCYLTVERSLRRLQVRPWRKMSALSAAELAVDQTSTPHFCSLATCSSLDLHTVYSIGRGTCRRYAQATRTRTQRRAVELAASPVRALSISPPSPDRTYR